MRYAFIQRHAQEHSVRHMCKVMPLHPSGVWKVAPQSPRAKDDQRLLGLLKQAWLESGGVYGYCKLALDMRDLGEHCGKHRVARLLKLEGLRSQTGYGRRLGLRGGKPAVVAPNHRSVSSRWLSPITVLVHRHHPHPNPRRLAVPGGCGRAVLAPSSGLVHGPPH